MNRTTARRLGGSVAVLLVVELLCRVYLTFGLGQARMLQPDPRRLWRLGPAPAAMEAHYEVDADGFRAPLAPGPADAPLLLTLGDSSIFGDGVKDGSTLVEQIVAVLNADKLPARGRSLAVPGYSTLQTRVVMDDLGWSLKPRALVIGNLWSDSTLDIVRDLDLYHQFATPAARVEIQLSKLALFRVVKRGFNTARGKPAERVISWPQPGDTGLRRVPLPDYAANLEALLDAAQARDVGVVILGLCNRSMIERGRLDSDPVSPYSDAQYRIAQAHNVPYVDALTVLRRAGLPGGELFNDDLHPNAAGDALLGRAVAAALEEAGWSARVPVPLAAAPIHTGPDPWEGSGTVQPSSLAGSLATGQM